MRGMQQKVVVKKPKMENKYPSRVKCYEKTTPISTINLLKQICVKSQRIIFPYKQIEVYEKMFILRGPENADSFVQNQFLSQFIVTPERIFLNKK